MHVGTFGKVRPLLFYSDLVFFASGHSKRRNELGRQGRRVHIMPTSKEILSYILFLDFELKQISLRDKFTNKTNHLQYGLKNGCNHFNV